MPSPRSIQRSQGTEVYMRRTFLLLAKAAISGLLFYLSLRWVNFDALVQRLNHLEPGWLLFAVALLTLQLLLLSVRWRQIAVSCGTDMRFAGTLQINFIAAFFNQVLPSTVGGDGVRIWFAARSEEHTSELQSHVNLVCRLLLEKKKKKTHNI